MRPYLRLVPTNPAEATLITIPFSHYCEKARWALDLAGVAYREEGHVPALHMRATFGAGGKRTVPVLVTRDGVLDDSTAIVEYADRVATETGKLFPAGEAARAEVATLEERFDIELGPHIRRVLYFHLLPDRALTLSLMRHATPAWERGLLNIAFPVLRAVMRRKMRIDAPSAERSLTKVRRVFDDVAARLADGRRYLVGDHLTAADVTFAALIVPVTRPPEYPVPIPSADQLPDAARRLVEELAATPAGVFATRLYREHRPVTRSAYPAA